jgi:hypothetical protein
MVRYADGALPVVDTRAESFDFLGYRFDRDKRLVRPKGLARLKDAVRGKTRRTDGRSLPLSKESRPTKQHPAG